MRTISSVLRSLVLAIFILAMSSASFAQISIVIRFGPPPIPVYLQPPCPAEGFIWVPGYWAYDYDDGDYFWVPGTWVLAPEPGLLWTPGYWAWDDDRFFFHEGYWGPRVGFYGGINYGFGYFGEGYEGGRWDGDRFFYNRSVTNINATNIHNVYNQTIINKTVVENHISYDGGNGGIQARPTHEQELAAQDRHIAPLEVQTLHLQAARLNPQQHATSNLGRPNIAATLKPGQYDEHAIMHAKEAGAPYTPPPNPNQGRFNKVHPNDLPPVAQPGTPKTGNSQMDQKFQQEQEKIHNQQALERQKLQQQQELEHQRQIQQQANEAAKQQLEQKHQQETLQLARQHAQQMQQLQEKYQAHGRNQPEPPKGGRPPEKH